MPRWLKWWFALFVTINLAGVIGNFPNPITLIWQVATQPAPEARTLDGGIRGLSILLAAGMVIGWIILAVILKFTLKDKPKKKK